MSSASICIFLVEMVTWQSFTKSESSRLDIGPIRTRHFYTQYRNKKILRLRDNFEPWMPIGQGKFLTKHNARYVMIFWGVGHLNLWLKIIKYCNVILSFYRDLVCKHI